MGIVRIFMSPDAYVFHIFRSLTTFIRSLRLSVCYVLLPTPDTVGATRPSKVALMYMAHCPDWQYDVSHCLDLDNLRFLRGLCIYTVTHASTLLFSRISTLFELLRGLPSQSSRVVTAEDH